MARYKILEDGVEVARILADEQFMSEHYSEYELIPEPVVTHKKTFSAEELHNSFTADEAIAALASTNPLVRAQAELLGMKRNKVMSYNEQGYIDAIGTLRTASVLDSDTADSYLLGIPLDRLQ